MRNHRAASFALIAAPLVVTLLAGCGRSSSAGVEEPIAAQGECTPLETRAPNGTGQTAAFEGQTRACGAVSNITFDVTVVAKGLEHPWAVEPLPGGDLLITERPGRMRIVTAAGQIGEPLANLPAVAAGGQGGLLDVALSPSFDSDRTIYWSFSEPRQGGNATSVARAVLSTDRRSLEQVRVIFQAKPTYDGDKHFGSRLVFGTDGTLFVTLGERSDTPMRVQAQQLDSHMGKIVRINTDGSPAQDNPYSAETGALPEIWSMGHRNIQAAALDSQGRLWEIEHGARGGDELNLVEKGKNYGWPDTAYGIEYAGAPIAGAVTSKPGYEQPVYYWDPVIAPSGLEFYSGSAFPEWRDSLFVGSMVQKRLVRLTLDGARVKSEEHLLADRNQRVRDVRQGPDGALYIVTDEDSGELWKIAPRR